MDEFLSRIDFEAEKWFKMEILFQSWLEQWQPAMLNFIYHQVKPTSTLQCIKNFCNVVEWRDAKRNSSRYGETSTHGTEKLKMNLKFQL